MNSIRGLSAHTVFSNTRETDLLPEVLCEVKGINKNGAEVYMLVMAKEPGDAIDKANRTPMGWHLKGTKNFKTGDKIVIINNSVFECMGFRKVSGKIVILNPNNEGCSIQCDQTDCLEIVDFDDGDIQIITEV